MHSTVRQMQVDARDCNKTCPSAQHRKADAGGLYQPGMG